MNNKVSAVKEGSRHDQPLNSHRNSVGGHCHNKNGEGHVSFHERISTGNSHVHVQEKDNSTGHLHSNEHVQEHDHSFANPNSGDDHFYNADDDHFHIYHKNTCCVKIKKFFWKGER